MGKKILVIGGADRLKISLLAAALSKATKGVVRPETTARLDKHNTLANFFTVETLEILKKGEEMHGRKNNHQIINEAIIKKNQEL